VIDLEMHTKSDFLSARYYIEIRAISKVERSVKMAMVANGVL